MKDFIKTHKWEVPLYVIAAGLPLIVQFHIQPSWLDDKAWFPTQKLWSDFFLYGKSRFVHYSGLLLLLLLIIQRVCKRSFKFAKEWLLILFFGVLQLCSAFFSSYPESAFIGSIEQFESIWVLQGYLIIGAYAYWCAVNGNSSKMLMRMMIVGSVIACILGITQFFQMDFWSWDIGKRLLIPETYADLRENLRFNFSINNWGQVYLANYNPNYAAIYLLMILPIVLLWENIKVRYWGILLGICLLGTFSKTAFITAIIISIVGVILFRNIISDNTERVIKKGIFFGFLFFGVFFILEKDNVNLSYNNNLQSVICKDDFIEIYYGDEVLQFQFEQTLDAKRPYSLVYQDGKKIDLVWNETIGEMIPVDEKLQGIRFKVYEKDNALYGMFRYQEIPFRFIKNETEGYSYVSINGKIDEIETAQTLWEGNEDFLNGRGYVWARVFPIILKNPWLGTGPDSFIQVFPQDDYVARSNLGYEFFTQILTNAHSLYLQMTLQIGIPAVVCFFLFVVVYLKNCWNLYYRKDFYTTAEKMGAAIFLSVVGYLICGITFASSVCTTPFFWILIGTGCGINQKIQRHLENK